MMIVAVHVVNLIFFTFRNTARKRTILLLTLIVPKLFFISMPIQSDMCKYNNMIVSELGKI